MSPLFALSRHVFFSFLFFFDPILRTITYHDDSLRDGWQGRGLNGLSQFGELKD